MPCRNTPARLSKCCGRATLPSARPLNGTGVSHKTLLFRSWIYRNETNGTHSRYNKCVFSYDECLIPTLSRYGSAHGVVHSGTKVGH